MFTAPVTRPPRRAQSAYSAARWKLMKEAHALLTAGQVRSGLAGFRSVLRGIGDLMGGQPVSWPLLGSDPESPSAAWALIYLRDFFQLTKTWRAWLALAAPVMSSPLYPRLSPLVRAHIAAGYGAARMGRARIEDVIDDLDRALAEVRAADSTAGRYVRLCVHLACAEANTRAMRHSAAIGHANAAVALADGKAAPYYAIRAYEEVATATYNAGTVDDDPALYAASLDAYDKADAIVNRIGEQAWSMARDYGKGWLFNKLENWERAVEHFERGAHRRADAGLLYDAGRCYYGMGYTLFRLERYGEARASLERALTLFSDDQHDQLIHDALGVGTRSPQMMALTLQILGLVEQAVDDLRDAYDSLVQSREHLLTITLPAPWRDTLTPLTEVCRALGLDDEAARYQDELDDLHSRYELPK